MSFTACALPFALMDKEVDQGLQPQSSCGPLGAHRAQLAQSMVGDFALSGAVVDAHSHPLCSSSRRFSTGHQWHPKANGFLHIAMDSRCRSKSIRSLTVRLFLHFLFILSDQGTASQQQSTRVSNSSIIAAAHASKYAAHLFVYCHRELLWLCFSEVASLALSWHPLGRF